jgi:DnaJ-class molecular chaperone
MATMQQAVQFLRDFVKQEHDTEVTLWSERDAGAAQKQIGDLNHFFGAGMTSDLHRPGKVPEQYFVNGAMMLKNAAERRIFKVEEYEHPKHGALFRAVVGTRRRLGTSYATAFFLAGQGSDLKIVALYNTCKDCDGAGRVEGRKCPECGGSGWINRGGEEIDDPGKLVRVEKLTEPSDAAHLAEYEATG